VSDQDACFPTGSGFTPLKTLSSTIGNDGATGIFIMSEVLWVGGMHA
jgi:hypothetical protein